MSLDSLRDFRAKINETPALQASIRPYLQPSVMTFDVVRIGKDHGFDFTQEEVIEVYESEMTRSTRELSDYELELVAGGTAAPVGPSSFSGQTFPSDK